MKKRKFRFVYLDNGWDNELNLSVAEIISKDFYAIIGNGNYFKIKNLKYDWGKKSKWGKYIKI